VNTGCSTADLLLHKSRTLCARGEEALCNA